jgi:hypothetical protein
MFRTLRLCLAVLITAAAFLGVVRLTVPADGAHGVRKQLAFVKDELRAGAASRAQGDFPEGYFFLYALYGLAEVDLGLASPPSSRSDELREARWALAALSTAEGRRPFASPDLPLPYGVFYRGWVNWLRGGILSLQPAEARDPAEVRLFEADSAELAAAFDASATPFLAAYPGQSWPVDSTVAMASLSLHDHLLPARFETTKIRWLANVKARLDPATGLMPHMTDVDTGETLAGARGSSQSIIGRFLPEIDAAFSTAQYVRFRELFLSAPLGLGPAVREYPAGVNGSGDADSGPLLLGVSLSATVVTIGAARVEGDESLASALANFGEVAGAPLDTPHSRRYAFGALPIGDAFLAWSKTARPWVLPAPGAALAAVPAPGLSAATSVPPRIVSRWWRLPLLTFFLAVGAAPWIAEAARRRRKIAVSD